MNRKKADIITVANAAGVSPSTVSRYFNHGHLLKAATRQKIEEAVKDTGYIRNRAAQTIHGIRSGTIGLIVPTIDHAIFAELVQSFSEGVDAHGFTILLASHGYDLDREYALVRKMLEHRVDGLALIGLEHAAETHLLLERQETPVISLWNHNANARLPCIGADNFEAGKLIGAHVAALGHTKVASLFPPLSGNDRAAQRFAGVCNALSVRDVTIPTEWQIHAPYSVGGAKTVLKELLTQQDVPTALVCGNDVLAIGALHAANSIGIDVPDDLTVTGIGDFKGSRDFEPALTTVRIPARQIGLHGAEVISTAITQQDTVIQGALITAELMARGTSRVHVP